MIRPAYITTLTVIVFYVAISLWVIETRRPNIVVDVQNNPSMSEMARVIQEQKERIQYLSSHPKIVYRCADDESKIKYPRKASDELTEIKMNTNDECGNSSIDAVVLVHTSADHFKRRERFRMAYANYSNTNPYRLKVVFLIGSVLDASLQIQLEMENMKYGDTVVGSFLDTYQNLTLKAVMGFRWLANTCSDVKLLIKLDDDVFLDVRKFFTNYWQPTNINRKKRTIHCLVWHNARVGRTGKWKVEKGLFANASYPFPYCAGFLALVTPDLIQPMYTYGKSIDFFWIDDVFLYGMAPAAMQGVNFVHLGRSPRLLTQNYKEYQQCRESKGVDCPLWATLTNGEDEFDREFALVASPQPTVNTAVGKTVYSKDNIQIVVSINNNSSKAILEQKNVPAINGTAVKSKGA